MIFTATEAIESSRQDSDFFMTTEKVDNELRKHGFESGGIDWCDFFGNVKEVKPNLYAAKDVVEWLGY